MAPAGFLEDVLQRVETESGVLERIIPRVALSHAPRQVQISPFVAFGHPAMADTGVKVRAVAFRYDAGDELDDIAADHGVPVTVVKDAISFHVAVA